MQALPGSVVAPGPLPSATEADYQRLFDLSLDLLCVAAADGFFKRVNPSWTRVLGWSEAELLARPIFDLVHPDDQARTRDARAELFRGLPVRGLENRYRARDGSYRWLSWQSVLEPATGRVYAVARDITERRQLDQERLVMSKLESTGILAAGVAHDFNNLFASLLLNIEMVGVSSPVTSAQDHCLRQAVQTIRSARALTQQLITFAAGGATSRRVADIRPLLRQSFELALASAPLQSECHLAADLWPAEIDEPQLAQVFRGLLLNAREATPPRGRVRLVAENLASGASAEQPPGPHLRISITDTGTGIAPEVMPKIFDPYFSTKQRGAQKGMGLGLAICRTVLQRHQGTIAVTSRLGTGTTVVCHLPATPQPPTDPAR